MVDEPENGNGAPAGKPVRLPHMRCATPGEKHLYIFMPQSGITPDELAAAVELVTLGIVMLIKPVARSMSDALFAEMDAPTRRHWVVQDLPKVVGVKKNNRLHLPPGMR